MFLNLIISESSEIMSANIRTLQEMDDPVVISGMSGRFPESETTDELALNLYENKDFITEDDRRFPRSES